MHFLLTRCIYKFLSGELSEGIDNLGHEKCKEIN